MQSLPVNQRQALYLAFGKAFVLTAATTALTLLLLAWLDSALLNKAREIHGLSADFLKEEFRIGNLIVTALIIELPLVFTIYQAALKTKGVAKCIVTLQIIVLGYFCQWLAWSTFSLQTSPMALILGLAGGFIWGQIDGRVYQVKMAGEKNNLIIALKEKELKEAHLQLVKQDEADRRILASDLHDQVLNDLKSLRVAIGNLKQEKDESKRTEKLVDIESMIDQTTSQVRDVMENLTPSVLENLGLASALDDLVRRSGIAAHLKVRFKNDAGDSLGKLQKIEQLLLFRTVQEALSNIIKHAQATRVEVYIVEQTNELIITIIDDGVGFPQDKERGVSRGLRYMRQRADLMGARIAWLPGKQNKGCMVEIKIEMKEA